MDDSKRNQQATGRKRQSMTTDEDQGCGYPQNVIDGYYQGIAAQRRQLASDSYAGAAASGQRSAGESQTYPHGMASGYNPGTPDSPEVGIYPQRMISLYNLTTPDGPEGARFAESRPTIVPGLADRMDSVSQYDANVYGFMARDRGEYHAQATMIDGMLVQNRYGPDGLQRDQSYESQDPQQNQGGGPLQDQQERTFSPRSIQRDHYGRDFDRNTTQSSRLDVQKPIKREHDSENLQFHHHSVEVRTEPLAHQPRDSGNENPENMDTYPSQLPSTTREAVKQPVPKVQNRRRLEKQAAVEAAQKQLEEMRARMNVLTPRLATHQKARLPEEHPAINPKAIGGSSSQQMNQSPMGAVQPPGNFTKQNQLPDGRSQEIRKDTQNITYYPKPSQVLDRPSSSLFLPRPAPNQKLQPSHQQTQLPAVASWSSNSRLVAPAAQRTPNNPSDMAQQPPTQTGAAQSQQVTRPGFYADSSEYLPAHSPYMPQQHHTQIGQTPDGHDSNSRGPDEQKMQRDIGEQGGELSNGSQIPDGRPSGQIVNSANDQETFNKYVRQCASLAWDRHSAELILHDPSRPVFNHASGRIDAAYDPQGRTIALNFTVRPDNHLPTQSQTMYVHWDLAFFHSPSIAFEHSCLITVRQDYKVEVRMAPTMYWLKNWLYTTKLYPHPALPLGIQSDEQALLVDLYLVAGSLGISHLQNQCLRELYRIRNETMVLSLEACSLLYAHSTKECALRKYFVHEYAARLKMEDISEGAKYYHTELMLEWIELLTQFVRDKENGKKFEIPRVEDYYVVEYEIVYPFH